MVTGAWAVSPPPSSHIFRMLHGIPHLKPRMHATAIQIPENEMYVLQVFANVIHDLHTKSHKHVVILSMCEEKRLLPMPYCVLTPSDNMRNPTERHPPAHTKQDPGLCYYLNVFAINSSKHGKMTFHFFMKKKVSGLLSIKC